MKVLKRNLVKVNNLKDYFVKDLTVEPSSLDVVKEQTVNGNLFRVGCEVLDDSIEIVVNVWNENAGVDLGIREYNIPLFRELDKERIKLTNNTVGLAIIEALNNVSVGFTQLGSGYISDWISNEDETVLVKLWFSESFDYMTISRKTIEPVEQTVSKEELLDRLGL